MSDTTSWWVGLSREELTREIAARADYWAKQQIGLLDTIGEKLRESWEPRPSVNLRGPIR